VPTRNVASAKKKLTRVRVLCIVYWCALVLFCRVAQARALEQIATSLLTRGPSEDSFSALQFYDGSPLDQNPILGTLVVLQILQVVATPDVWI